MLLYWRGQNSEYAWLIQQLNFITSNADEQKTTCLLYLGSQLFFQNKHAQEKAEQGENIKEIQPNTYIKNYTGIINFQENSLLSKVLLYIKLYK